MLYIGSHISGPFENSPIIANQANINTIMIMPTSPLRWALKPIDEKRIKKFAQNIKINLETSKNPLKNILLHAIYLINLARSDKRLFHLSKMSLITYIDFLDKVKDELKNLNIDDHINLLGICFHPGSANDQSEQEAIKRVAYGIDWILEKTKQSKVKLLIENTAGSGNIIGSKFEQLKQIKDLTTFNTKRVGFVIDTQHSFASGYDWHDTQNVIKIIDDLLNIKNVKAFHLNDSKVKLNSHIDRHANIGEGFIGLKTLKNIIFNKDLSDMPFILETPNVKTEQGIEKEIQKLIN